MRTVFVALIVAAVFFGSAEAQDQTARQNQLRQQVMQRLLQNVRAQTGMTDEHFERYREIARRSMASRNEIQRRERELWRGLEGQMRPGVAANEDRVVALIDSLIAVPAQQIQLARGEQEEYAEFLTPVQRAQLVLIHRRFQNNIQQIMQRRLPNRPGQGSREP
jgi:hypothetical protein